MKIPAPNTSGARLRSARKARGLSQIELADMAGFSRPHITHMELNTYRGGRASWEAVAGALGVSLDYLLSGESPPSGFGEATVPSILKGAPDDNGDDEHFIELADALTAMLREEQMAADARTVARLAAMVWRDIQVLPGAMSFADRLDLTLSERRSAIQAARDTMFSKVK